METNQASDLRALTVSFLATLKEGRFAVGVKTYVEALNIVDKCASDSSFKLEDLAKYLSPLICRSNEEQKEFHRLFEKEIIQPYAGLIRQRIEKLDAQRMRARKIRNRVILPSLILVILVVLTFVIYSGSNSPSLGWSSFTHLDSTFNNLGSPASINPELLFANKKDTARIGITQRLHSQKDTVHTYRHSFYLNKAGIDTLSFRLYSDKYHIDTTVYEKCYVAPEWGLQIVPSNEIAYLNTPATFQLEISDSLPLPFTWYVNDSSAADWINKKELTYTFPDTGTYTISVRYTTKTDPFLSKFPRDFFSTSVTQSVQRNKIDILTDTQPLPAKTVISTNSRWVILLSLCALACMGWTYYISRRMNKIRKEHAPVKLVELDNLNGQAPPHEIPYQPKDHQVAEITELRKLANDLKKSTESPIRSFDSKKTIERTIKNIELIDPVFKTRKSDVYYLFLVDCAYANSQQFKLFSFLIKYFINRSVSIDFYYYYQEPDLFYKADEGGGCTIQQLANSYYNSNLFVFSSAYNFLDYHNPRVKNDYLDQFSFWQNRILVTPVPYVDWGANEQALAGLFDLVPADVVGLLEIISLLQTDRDKRDLFAQKKLATYESAYVDVNNYSSLAAYLDHDEDLIQWLCALAVYTKISWDVTIAIGRTITGARSYKVNYENLLKFARVKWMQEGRFTASIRLALLKKLSLENELKARAALLNLLEEVQLDETVFSYEEKMVNKYTSSFVLFATADENKDIYRPIYNSEEELKINAEKFISLYSKQQLSDTSLKIYLEQGNNRSEEPWDTPVMIGNKPVGIQEFVQHRAENENLSFFAEQKKKISRWKKWQKISSGIAFAFMLLASSLLVFMDQYAASKINRLLNLEVTHTTIPDSSFLYLISTPCSRKLLLETPGSNIYYSVSRDSTIIRSGIFITRVDDTVKLDLTAQTDPLQVVMNINGQAYRSILLPAPNTAYYVSLRGKACDSVIVYKDTVDIVYSDTTQRQAAYRLKDTLESLHYYVPVVKERGLEPYRQAPNDNEIRYYSPEKQPNIAALSNVVNNFFRIKKNSPGYFRMLKYDLSLPEKDRNILKIWIKNTGAYTPPPSDTVNIFVIGTGSTLSRARTFSGFLNRTGRFYSEILQRSVDSGLRHMSPGSSEVTYFYNKDSTAAKLLAKTASDYFRLNIKANKPEFPVSLSETRHMQLWIDVPTPQKDVVMHFQEGTYSSKGSIFKDLRRFRISQTTYSIMMIYDQVATSDTQKIVYHDLADKSDAESIADTVNKYYGSPFTTRYEPNAALKQQIDVWTNYTPAPANKSYQQPAQKYMSLVFGVENYKNINKLEYSRSDASAMRAALNNIAPGVQLYLDPTYEAMTRSCYSWLDQLPDTGTCIFYFSGSGVESNGVYYLLPVDATVNDKQLITQGFALNGLLDRLSQKSKDLNKIVLIDACRTARGTDVSTGNSSSINALIERSDHSFGLTPALIGFATHSGGLAYEYQQLKGGVFTTSLLKYMQVPNLSVNQLIREVTQQVREQTKGAQVPVFSTTLPESFHFR